MLERGEEEEGEQLVLAGAAPPSAASAAQPQQLQPQRAAMRMAFEMEQLEVCAAYAL